MVQQSHTTKNLKAQKMSGGASRRHSSFGL